jgi:hypothetical protein
MIDCLARTVSDSYMHLFVSASLVNCRQSPDLAIYFRTFRYGAQASEAFC